MKFIKTYEIFKSDNIQLPGGYNMGDCNLFAIALHRIFKYPIYTVRGYYKEDDYEEVISMGMKPVYYFEDSHVVIKLPNGEYMDADGVMSKEELLKSCMFGKHIEKIKIEPISELEAFNIFYGIDEQETIKESDEKKVNRIINNINRLNESVSKKFDKILYHGSDNRFTKFSFENLGSNMGKTPSNLKGFFFSDNIEVAKSFGKYLYTCQIDFNKPFIIDVDGKDYSEFKHELNDIVINLDINIYDSIIIKNYKDSMHDEPIISNQYIIFNNTDIKIINIK